MTKVLFFTDVHAGTHAAEYAGVCERAADYGMRIIEIEYARTGRSAAEFIAHWQPAGLIVECSSLVGSPNLRVYGNHPAVFIDPCCSSAVARQLFIVKQDASAIAAAAIKELSAANPAAYAYVGWAGRQTWSAERGNAFSRLVAKKGKKCLTFRKTWMRTDFLSFQRDLTDWLHTLPRPCAVFAANDETAEQVVVASARMGLNCPDDIVIIGVDNDLFRCETCFPTISSVEIDYQEIGRMAVDLLARQFEQKADARPQTILCAPVKTIQRNSTRILATHDPMIHAILERIAHDACSGLTALDIIKSQRCSRRLVEQRFRSAVGQSLGDEIFRVRFDKAQNLLRHTKMPIEQIAAECGWKSTSFLKRTFKRRTGLTMREWRNLYATQS